MWFSWLLLHVHTIRSSECRKLRVIFEHFCANLLLHSTISFSTWGYLSGVFSVFCLSDTPNRKSPSIGFEQQTQFSMLVLHWRKSAQNNFRIGYFQLSPLMMGDTHMCHRLLEFSRKTPRPILLKPVYVLSMGKDNAFWWCFFAQN